MGAAPRTAQDSALPFDEGDIREACGFDRNDPNVHVTMHALNGPADLEKIFREAGGYSGDDTIIGGYRPGNAAPSLRDLKSFERACEDKALGWGDTATAAPEPYVNPYAGDEKLTAAIRRDPEGSLQRILSLTDKDESVTAAARDVLKEVARAVVLHGPMKSGHEGYAVLLEEVEELWDLVKTDKVKSPEGRKEAIQIAAMAIRFIADVIEAE